MANSKTEMLKALLRHKDNLEMFREAANSPLGSTARSKAKRVLSILNKLQTSRDGQGGPGQTQNGMGLPPVPYQPTPEEPQQGVVIFHKLPPMNVSFGGMKKHDGAGGPGALTNTVPQMPMFTLPTTPKLGTGYGTTGNDNTGGAYTNAGQTVSAPSETFTNPLSNYQTLGNIGSINTSGGSEPLTPGLSTNAKPVAPVTSFNPSANPTLGAQIKFDPTKLSPTADLKQSTTAVKPVVPVVPVTSGETQKPAGPIAPIVPIAPAAKTQYTPTGGTVTQSDGQTFDLSRWAVLDNGTTNPTHITNVQNSLNTMGTLKTAADITAYIQKTAPGSPITAEMVMSASEKYGVPWEIILATANAETHLGTDGSKGATQFNYGNVGNTNSLMAAGGSNPYSSPQDGVDAIAKTLTNGYYARNGVPGERTNASGIAGGSNLGVQNAVATSTGPGTYAWNTMMDKNNPITHGLTIGDAYVQNQQNIWDKYNIGGLSDNLNKQKDVLASIPVDTANYIRGRDQYLTQTNKEVDTLTSQLQNTSDPSQKALLKDQLNSLYTLRGAQSQTYVGYLNTAITQKQNEVTNLGNELNTKLTAYQNELNYNNTATQATYTQYSAALADLYTSVEGAPTKAAQLSLLNEQILAAHAQTVSDAAKLTASTTYTDDAAKLDKTGMIQDNNHYIMPNVNLIDVINNLNTAQPDVNTDNIVRNYLVGVNNVLAAGSSAKLSDGTPITETEKVKLAKNAINQFAAIALNAQAQTDARGNPSPNINSYNIGHNAAADLSSRIGNSVGGALNTGDIPEKITKAVEALSSGVGGFLGISKHTPSQKEFTDNFVKIVGPSLPGGVASYDLATAIWNQFNTYIKTGSSPADFVTAFTTDMTSTSGRAGSQPLSSADLMSRVGDFYGGYLLSSALSPSGKNGVQIASTLSQ